MRATRPTITNEFHSPPPVTFDVLAGGDVSGYSFFASATLPPLALQSAAVVLLWPWPLQAFLPAQEWPAPAQLPCPLQALIPSQITWSPPVFSSARAPTAPERNRAAAAVARRIPFDFPILRFSFLLP